MNFILHNAKFFVNGATLQSGCPVFPPDFNGKDEAMVFARLNDSGTKLRRVL